MMDNALGIAISQELTVAKERTVDVNANDFSWNFNSAVYYSASWEVSL